LPLSRDASTGRTGPARREEEEEEEEEEDLINRGINFPPPPPPPPPYFLLLPSPPPPLNESPVSTDFTILADPIVWAHLSYLEVYSYPLRPLFN